MKFRWNRGKNYFDDLQKILLAAISFEIFQIPLEYLGLFLPAACIFMYFLGYLDEKKGIWKTECEYATRELNPVFREILSILREQNGGKKG